MNEIDVLAQQAVAVAEILEIGWADEDTVNTMVYALADMDLPYDVIVAMIDAAIPDFLDIDPEEYY